MSRSFSTLSAAFNVIYSLDVAKLEELARLDATLQERLADPTVDPTVQAKLEVEDGCVPRR